jgi:hypothetical protein
VQAHIAKRCEARVPQPKENAMTRSVILGFAEAAVGCG